MPSLESRTPLCRACDAAERTIVVTVEGDGEEGDCTPNNSGEGCTLRQAIDYANNNDPFVLTRIEFAAGVERVSLDAAAAPLGPIAASVCIDGRANKNGGMVTVSRPLFAESFMPARSGFQFFYDPDPSGGAVHVASS